MRKALETSRKIKDTTLEAGVRNNLGHTLRLLGKDGEAVKELTAARDIAEANKDLARAGSYNFNLGLALYQSRRFELGPGVFPGHHHRPAGYGSRHAQFAHRRMEQGQSRFDHHRRSSARHPD